MTSVDLKPLDVPAETLLHMYRTMSVIRRFEERAAELYKTGAIPGLIHVSIGQEASATGACAALEAEDCIVPTHRGHGQCIAKGAEPRLLMAELMGRSTGYCRGKGGSMHIVDLSHGILMATGVLAAGLPVAAGAALAFQTRGERRVALGFFGEGASSEGAAHEAMNLAALWQLPVIFLCESNGYAEFTGWTEHVPIPNLSDRAAGYGMPGCGVDGNDVVAVFLAVRQAAQRARQGGGPSLIEAKTTRWHGHYIGDAQKYRSASELDEIRARDPVVALGDRLAHSGLASAATLASLDREAESVVDEAVAFAEASPSPDAEELTSNVFV